MPALNTSDNPHANYCETHNTNNNLTLSIVCYHCTTGGGGTG